MGGFLAGGGYNALGTSARYGIGALNVIGLEVVLADGSIAWVDEDRTVVQRPGGVREVVTNRGDINLFFCLRGAGSSFGIVTEYLYKVTPSIPG